MSDDKGGGFINDPPSVPQVEVTTPSGRETASSAPRSSTPSPAIGGGTFAAQLKAFAEKATAAADEVIGVTVFQIAERVIKRSPVGNPDLWKGKAPAGYIGGHFRANWQFGVDVRPEGEVPTIDKTGAITIGKIMNEIGSVPQMAGHTFWLANNLPYALRLEYGHSTQAPQGMVGLTLAELSSILDYAVKSTKS